MNSVYRTVIQVEKSYSLHPLGHCVPTFSFPIAFHVSDDAYHGHTIRWQNYICLKKSKRKNILEKQYQIVLMSYLSYYGIQKSIFKT